MQCGTYTTQISLEEAHIWHLAGMKAAIMLKYQKKIMFRDLKERSEKCHTRKFQIFIKNIFVINT